jgi:hypothetical protein
MVTDRAFELQRCAAGGFEQAGIGDGVAGIKDERMTADVGVVGAGRLVSQRQPSNVTLSLIKVCGTVPILPPFWVSVPVPSNVVCEKPSDNVPVWTM